MRELILYPLFSVLFFLIGKMYSDRKHRRRLIYYKIRMNTLYGKFSVKR